MHCGCRRDALVLAGKIFSQDSRKHVLVLCSDGVQDSAELSFYKTHITPEFIGSFIGRLKRAGRLPDLRSVQVFVVGASGAVWRGRRVNAEYEMETFWRSLVQASGGDLLSEHYGPALMDFHQLSLPVGGHYLGPL
jgi:hypothetical protein